jgi:hypothetical protein
MPLTVGLPYLAKFRRGRPDPLRRHRNRRQYRDRLEPGARRLRHIAAECELIGKKIESNNAASARCARSM